MLRMPVSQQTIKGAAFQLFKVGGTLTELATGILRAPARWPVAKSAASRTSSTCASRD